MPIDVRSSLATPLYAAPLSFSASLQFIRPNNTTQYTANDVIGDVYLGATLPFNFAPVVPANGGEVVIDAVRFEHDETALIAAEASHALAFYNRPPPSALADNAGYDVAAADRLAYQGIVTLGTPVDVGSTCYIEVSALNKRLTLLSSTVYCYLTTAGAYIPVGLDVYRLTLYGRLI